MLKGKTPCKELELFKDWAKPSWLSDDRCRVRHLNCHCYNLRAASLIYYQHQGMADKDRAISWDPDFKIGIDWLPECAITAFRKKAYYNEI